MDNQSGITIGVINHNELTSKVDKVVGSSLVADADIEKIHGIVPESLVLAYAIALG